MLKVGIDVHDLTCKDWRLIKLNNDLKNFILGIRLTRCFNKDGLKLKVLGGEWWDTNSRSV